MVQAKSRRSTHINLMDPVLHCYTKILVQDVKWKCLYYYGNKIMKYIEFKLNILLRIKEKHY